MWDCPAFLDLPERGAKPRTAGITHVIDTGANTALLEAVLTETGHLIDILKVGWGISYIDRNLKSRLALCSSYGVTVCLGGTLLEVCEAQGKLSEFRRWAQAIGVDAVEVSNGLEEMAGDRKAALIKSLSEDFTVLAETGSKSCESTVKPSEWIREMARDLQAGASYVVTEGRESGTVGLYREDGSLRDELLEQIVTNLPMERVIFEAPRKAQHAELINRLGAGVNVGNIAIADLLSLETLRLGLRADTAKVRIIHPEDCR